jgi:DNA-binding winged helix-turn-helix (wHTH) protein/TolB-like protein
VTLNDYIDLTRLEPFALGPLQICPAVREVVAGGERELIEPRVMQVLVALARRAGEVVSRDELITQCWAGRVVGDDAINRCVGRIRRLAETHGGFTLETLPRIGYRLNPIAIAAPADPMPIMADPSPRKPFLRVAILIAVTVLIAAVAAWKFWPQPAPRTFTIAVLPFTPLYEGANAQNLGDSIAAGIADMLSGYRLDVVSPTKSFQFRGADKSRAPQALGADFVIDGEIRREQGRYLVAIRIIEGASGTTLLAENLERPLSDEADLPENVAGRVAGLEWLVTAGFGRSAKWDRRVMAGALRASHLMMSRGDYLAANDIARQGEKVAPGDAFAYALHVRTALKLESEAPLPRRPALLAEARQAADMALKLDPQYADAYALHSLTIPTYDWAARDKDLRQAFAILPKAPIAYMYGVEFLQNTGRFRDSAQIAEKAYAASPYLADINAKTLNSRLWSGQIVPARTLIARGGKVFPTGSWLAAKAFEAAAFYGAPGDAEALLAEPAIRAQLDPVDGPQTFSKIARAVHTRRPDDIAAMAADCVRTDARSPEQFRLCFQALAMLGRLDEGFRLAAYFYPDQRGASAAERDRKWLAAPAVPTAYLLVPPTASLRADPRFRDVVDRIGLLPYWRASGVHPDFCASEAVAVCRM